MDWEKDPGKKIHPTQKPIKVLMRLIEIFTDEYDVVIDPVAGSGSTLIAAKELNRNAYGFEIKKEYYLKAKEWIDECDSRPSLFMTSKPKTKYEIEHNEMFSEVNQ